MGSSVLPENTSDIRVASVGKAVTVVAMSVVVDAAWDLTAGEERPVVSGCLFGFVLSVDNDLVAAKQKR